MVLGHGGVSKNRRVLKTVLLKKRPARGLRVRKDKQYTSMSAPKPGLAALVVVNDRRVGAAPTKDVVLLLLAKACLKRRGKGSLVKVPSLRHDN